MHSQKDSANDDSPYQHRRQVLQAIGAVGITGIAGCLADDSDGTDDDDPDDADDADDAGDVDDTTPDEGFHVHNLDPADVEVEVNSQIDVSAVIENVGPVEATQIIDYRVAGEILQRQPVELGSGDQEQVTFSDVSLDDFEVGEYDHGIFSHDDSDTGRLSIATFGPPMPPKDPYEDIIGLHPEDAAESFSVAPGFTIELVASEPLIDTPVDIRWDASGRMWVCQMPDNNALHPGDGRGGEAPGNWPDGSEHAENDLETLTGWGDSLDNEPPNGSITVLEDTTGDGYYDESTTFLDELTSPRSVSLVNSDDAVLVAHAGQNVDEPDLLLCRDTDGDGVSDEEIGVKDEWVHPVVAEFTSNGLEYMLDNWLHSSQTSDRFQVRGNNISEQSDTSGYGQWGITEDIYGRTYFTQNTIYLLQGDFGPEKGQNTNTIDDGSIVHPIRPNRGTNRYYVPIGETQDGWNNFHREDDRLRNATATSGPGVYQGHLFPDEYVNDVFSAEPQGNLVAHLRLTDDPNSLDITSEHRKYEHTSENNPYEDELDLDEVEFVATWDEVFRPVNIRTGPDGALYIVDMYKGVIQHWLYLTAYFADYAYRNNLWAIDELEHGSGRIWRVYPEDAELEAPPDLSEADTEALVEYLGHENGWVRKTAQRLLVQGQRNSAVEDLRALAQNDGAPALGRMHALWTLHGLEAVDGESVFAVFDDSDNSHIIANAIQVGEALYGTDDEAEYVGYLDEFESHDHERIATQAENSR